MWAFISSLVAIVAVAITYFQWRTAQTQVALGIHAARYAIYQELRKAGSDFLRELNFSLELQGKYMDAQSRARFHFGTEVEQYLESLRADMIKGHNRYGPDRYGQLQPGRHYADELTARLDRINAFYKEIDRMFVPYMRLDQRMPLWWWTPLVTKIKSCAIRLQERMRQALRRTPPAH
jgi:hypothetical protein